MAVLVYQTFPKDDRVKFQNNTPRNSFMIHSLKTNNDFERIRRKNLKNRTSFIISTCPTTCSQRLRSGKWRPNRKNYEKNIAVVWHNKLSSFKMNKGKSRDKSISV